MTDPYHAPLGAIYYLTDPAPCEKCGSLTRYLFVAPLRDEDEEEVLLPVMLCMSDMQDYLVYAAGVLRERGVR